MDAPQNFSANMASASVSLPDFEESPLQQVPDSLMLYGFWYRALPGDQVAKGKLVAAKLLEVPLVLGRDADGRAFAMRNACPHRSIPLSCGRFDGRNVECSYHGWKFDGQTGRCTEIPSLTEDSKLKIDRIYATSYRCEEHDGFIWVFLPDAAVKPALSNTGAAGAVIPEVPRLERFSDDYTFTYLTADLACSVDHGIIGLMDPAHGPFVHQSWWWRTAKSIHEKQKAYEPIPNGFRMSAHKPSSNSGPYKLLRLYAGSNEITTTIDFVLPNHRIEVIRAGKLWFSSLTTVTPLTRDRCRIDVCAGWNIFRHVPGVLTIFRAFSKRFIAQDQVTMEQQSEGLKHTPALMLIDDADRPAKWYFQLKAAHLEAQRTGQPMKHPMDGPVVLRWRS